MHMYFSGNHVRYTNKYTMYSTTDEYILQPQLPNTQLFEHLNYLFTSLQSLHKMHTLLSNVNYLNILVGSQLVRIFEIAIKFGEKLYTILHFKQGWTSKKCRNKAGMKIARRLPYHGTIANKKSKKTSLHLLHIQQVQGSRIFLSAIISFLPSFFLRVFISAFFCTFYRSIPT